MRYGEILLERNILNLHEIDAFVNQMAALAQTQPVRQWVHSMLPAFLKKTYNRTQIVQDHDLPRYWPRGQEPSWAVQAIRNGDLATVVLDDALRYEVSEVIDYLESEAANHNLGRIPFEVALTKSKQWHAALAAQAHSAPISTGGPENVVKSYPDGSRWVRLTTTEALDQEGKVMGNCVGGGSYDEGVLSGQLRIFSFRDAKGESHITAAVTPTSIREIKGKQNKLPIAKYRPYVVDLLNSLHIVSDDSKYSDTYRMGIFYDAEKGYGTIRDIAQKSDVLPSGNVLAQLRRTSQSASYYITNSAGDVLASYYIVSREGKRQICDLNLSKNVPLRPLRDDLLTVMGNLVAKGYIFDSTTEFEIMYGFGIELKNKKLISISHTMKFVTGDMLIKAYLDDHDLVIADEAAQPLVFISISETPGTESPIANYTRTQPGWEKAIPVLIDAIKKTNINIIKSGLPKDLMNAGWFYSFSADNWVPANNLMQEGQSVYETVNKRNWMHVEHRLWLWDGHKIWAGLYIEDIKIDDAGKIFVIDEKEDSLIGNAEHIAEDVIDIFEAGIAEVSDDYIDQPFLIQYDVCTDGDGTNFVVVDWNEEVNVMYQVENVKGDIVKDERRKVSFLTAAQETNNEDTSETYSINYFCAKILLYREQFVHEDEFNDEQRDAITPDAFYDDPDEYRLENKIKQGRKLPAIKSETWTIWK